MLVIVKLNGFGDRLEMSTYDVPGANPINGDELKMGAWAEHPDGSMIHVESTENNRVVYHLFDTSKQPVIRYLDTMPEVSFKKTFSWKDGSKDKWIWHDKTPFPWDRVIAAGFSDGYTPAAGDIRTAAERIAQHLGLEGRRLREEDILHRADQTAPANAIMAKIGRAMDALVDAWKK